MVVTLVMHVGTVKTDPFCEDRLLVGFKGVRIRGDTKGRRNLLFSSQPFVTKLANTLSACVLLIGDVSAFTSRSAAREEMEYELFGASIICSTWGG
jgi:hypothetical protein